MPNCVEKVTTITTIMLQLSRRWRKRMNAFTPDETAHYTFHADFVRHPRKVNGDERRAKSQKVLTRYAAGEVQQTN